MKKSCCRWFYFNFNLSNHFSGLATQSTICDKSDSEKQINSKVGDNTAAYNDLKVISKKVKKICENVCDTKQTGVPGKYYNAIWKDFECQNLFEDNVFDRYLILLLT